VAPVAIGLIFFLALGARLIAHDVVITADEDNWMRRAGGFAYGLVNGQLGRTYQNGHPGVTTMWVAMLTLGPERMLQYADRVHEQRLVGRVPGFWDALVAARVGFAITNAGLVTLIAALAWRLVGPTAGLLAGLVVGLEPFYLGISQLVHMDAILSGAMVASVLAALVRFRGGHPGWLVLSGVLAGVAVLSKVPAVYLLAFVPLGAFLMRSSRGGGLASRLADATIFVVTTAITVVAFWPALWVLGPVDVLRRVVDFARETGGQPHEAGTFFWGVPTADPGPLFYPVATAFRLAPLTVLGLVLLVVCWRRVPSQHRPVALVLLAYVLGFVAMMTVGAKKFDRYLLPIYPALGVLAAVGLGSLTWSVKGVVRAPLAAVLLALAIWPPTATYPYFISYYNPLLGGGAVAQRTVMVGNGEGLDQVAEWLNAQPNARDLWITSDFFDILQPLILASGEPLRDRVPRDADYVVLYRLQMQTGQRPRVLAEYLDRQPEHSVWIVGIEYARVYRGPRLAASESR
jgi:4-amino-4-deoxy-L-arabinose transferase-like glycosyltransferase